MIKSESIGEISAALAKFRAEVKQPMKDADNPFFKSKYVPLPNVVEAIDETAPKHGLSYVQWPCNDETGRAGIATMIMHTSGEFFQFDPIFMKPEKETAQGAGALISYLKRYSLSAIFGITSDQDDDANDASGNTTKKITSKQVGLIKSRVGTFAGMYEDKTEDDVYQALKLKNGADDLSNVSQDNASKLIEKLDSWIKKTEEEKSKAGA